MQRLTFSEFLFTIIILLVIAFGASQLLLTWLNNVAEETSGRMQRAGRVYQ